MQSVAAVTLSILLLSGGLAPARNGEVTKRGFDLAAGDAAKTLKLFAAQARREVIFPVERVAGVTTRAVRGRFAPLVALGLMVDGTDLTVLEDAKTGAILIHRRSGGIPRTGCPG